MDNRIHNLRILQQNRCCLTHCYSQTGQHHALAAVEEGVADIVRLQAADNAGEHAHDDEERRNLVHVEVKLQHADDNADEVQAEQREADSLTRGQLIGLFKVHRIRLGSVDFVNRAALRVLLHLVRVIHDVGNVNRQQHKEDAHAVRQAGENRHTGNALGHADGERLRAACAIACGYRAEQHTECCQRVKAQRQRHAHYERRKCQVFLVAAGQRRERCQRRHEHRNQQNAVVAHLLDQCAQACYYSARFRQNVQRAAYHKEEGDNRNAALEAFIDGRKEIQEACRLLRNIMEGCRVNDHFARMHILHALIHAGRNNVAGDSTENNNADQN